MIREIFIKDLSLWVCVWQSTLFAVIGLVGSLFLKRRPARAFQVLFLTMTAAVLLPAMSVMVKHFDLGMFIEGPSRTIQETTENSIKPDYTTSVKKLSSEIQQEVQTGGVELTLQEDSSRQIKIPWRVIVLCGWMTTSLILLGRFCVAFVGGIFLLRRAQSNSHEQIRRAVDSARDRIGITKDLQVRNSQDVKSPVIWCWKSSPILLVPTDTDQEIDWISVICHELAHWKRKDHISGLITELVVCILPWNPILWWSKKRMIRFSEQACDDWVLAGGQSCEDYAQSLLNFRPQKLAAFVPAVVSSKKTLGGRIRRILKGSCTNPRIGVLWAMAACLIVLCLTIGIAFAQTRPAHSVGTVKTNFGKSAAIVRPVSDTIMIKGRILDPNGEPAYGAYIVAMPVTSWGYYTERNKEGYFELPWSPTWIEQGEPIYLMAIVQDPKSQAALIEVKDPTLPVNVQLKPAFSITGKVVDPDGQQIEECRATISLATEFKCRAPIYSFRGGKWWERMLSPLPYGTKYELTVQAEGYRIQQIIVDGTDRSQRLIDLGTIILQPQERVRTVVAKYRSDPDLEREFHEIYSLDRNEIIKLIKPPFVLGRQEYFQSPAYRYSGSFCSLDSQGAIQACLLWDGKELIKEGLWAYTNTHRPPTLGIILWLALRLQDYDFDLPKELNTKMPYGDWIVRADSPRDEQLRSLAEIVYAETKRVIRFEKRKIEREVIVAKGRYQFKSHPRGEFPNHVHLTWDGTFGNPERTCDSVAELFSYLERVIKMKIVNETEPTDDAIIPYKESQNLGWIPHEPDLRNARLSALLENLSLTTSLQFKVETRLAEIWFVTEVEEN